MKCANCPLFSSWNTENDRGEACGLFGDGWDDALQYEDKDGKIVGCYVDRAFILKREAEYEKELQRRVDHFLGQETMKEIRKKIMELEEKENAELS